MLSHITEVKQRLLVLVSFLLRSKCCYSLQKGIGYTTLPPPIFYSQCFPFTLASRVTANIVFLVIGIFSIEFNNNNNNNKVRDIVFQRNSKSPLGENKSQVYTFSSVGCAGPFWRRRGHDASRCWCIKAGEDLL